MTLEPAESVSDSIPVDVSAGFSDFDKGKGSQGGQQDPPPDVDTEAFNRFLAGDDEAFRLLYDAFERPLYLYVLRFVGGKTDAEDVFQDVWTRMYRLRGDMATVQKFSGLLFTIARNLSLNAIRDRKLLPGVSIDEAIETEFLQRNGDVEGADLRDMLERALQRLPAAQREIFILRKYFGYSYEEAAGIMGVPMATAKTRAWRARERMRRMISAWLELKNNSE